MHQGRLDEARKLTELSNTSNSSSQSLSFDDCEVYSTTVAVSTHELQHTGDKKEMAIKKIIITKNNSKPSPIVYTNHVLNNIQKLIFNNYYEYNIYGLAELFFMLNFYKVFIDNKTKTFTSYDINMCFWPTQQFLSFHKLFIETVGGFINPHIEKLKEYKNRFNNEDYVDTFYSELLTTQLYDRSKFNSNIDDEMRAIENFEIWHDIELWEDNIKRNHDYVLEAIDDPCVLKEVVDNDDFNQLSTNNNYITHLERYMKVNQGLAERYKIYCSAIYYNAMNGRHTLPESCLTDDMDDDYIDIKCKEMTEHIELEINHLNTLVSQLSQPTSQLYRDIFTSILDKKTIDSRIPSNRSYFIGTNNCKVLNLRTLTEEDRTDQHDIKCYCSRNYNSDVDTQYIDCCLQQMSGNDPINLEHIDNLLSLSLCANPRYPLLFSLTGSDRSKRHLFNLYLLTFGQLVKFIDYSVLTRPLNNELQVLIRDTRIIIVTNVSNVVAVPAENLNYCLDTTSIRDLGGKKYFNRTIFIFDGIPLVDENNMNKSYNIDIHDIDDDYLFSDLTDNILDSFFVTCTRKVQDICQNKLLIRLPQPVQTPNLPSHGKSIQQTIIAYKNLDLNSVISEFVYKRIKFNSIHNQEFPEIKDNFDIFLADVGLDQVFKLDIDSFSTRFNNVLREEKCVYTKKQEKLAYKYRPVVYRGLQSFPHDV
jgi:hypothetical protein